MELALGRASVRECHSNHSRLALAWSRLECSLGAGLLGIRIDADAAPSRFRAGRRTSEAVVLPAEELGNGSALARKDQLREDSGCDAHRCKDHEPRQEERDQGAPANWVFEGR